MLGKITVFILKLDRIGRISIIYILVISFGMKMFTQEENAK